MPEPIEYPKWLHFEGEPSVLVRDEGEEAAVNADREKVLSKPRRGRPPKSAEGSTDAADDDSEAVGDGADASDNGQDQ